MWPFASRRQVSQGEPFNPQVLNQLETRLERLELDNAQRQIAVLNLVEKVMHQLGARERKRAREPEETDAGDSSVGGMDSSTRDGGAAIPVIQSSAHLAKRFRGW